MTRLTVNDIFDSLEAVKRDISDVTTSQRLRMANMFNQEIYELHKSIKPYEKFAEYDFSTSSGVKRYDLPTDFESTTAMGTGLYQLNSDGTLGTQTEESDPGFTTDGYYFGGELILGVYTPSLYFKDTPTSSQDYRLIYNPELTEIKSLSDELLLEKKYIQLARDYLLKEYAIFDEDPAKEQIADQRYVLSKAEYVKKAKRTPAVYSI